MKISCFNEIVSTDLAINIDLTNTDSWNLNTGLTVQSLDKWSGAYSDNITLNDLGLTAFDTSRYNIMWSGITVTPSDTYLNLYKIGYNSIANPSSAETSGFTVTTTYLPITGITSTTKYFNLNGGYLQGFFKLKDYNYELFPSRYTNGITIENLIKIDSNSQGIFYTMGLRAEDKYNPYFSGETITGSSHTFTGVTTTEANYLNALMEYEKNKNAFADPQDQTELAYSATTQLENIKNNIIAFELTENRNLAYKLIDDSGLIEYNISPNTLSSTGFTLISIVFEPNKIITSEQLSCYARRLGTLKFYVNGRLFWQIKEFNEFYFNGLNNHKEKQEGVAYSISWGGGSFGLKHSWHYDYQTYGLYDGNDTTHINNNFAVRETPSSGTTEISGFTLSADSTTFNYTVFEIVNTGTTATTFYVRFNDPISVLSNRDYKISISLYDTGFFSVLDDNGEAIYNKITLLPYSDDIGVTITRNDEYVYPITQEYLNKSKVLGDYPFPDGSEYQYINDNGIMYYGATGLPVYGASGRPILYTESQLTVPTGGTMSGSLRTGLDKWNELNCTFNTTDNSGKENVYFGVLFECNADLSTGATIYFKDFKYIAADILVKDENKDNLMIEQNFDSSYIGGIQKLRIYNNALTSTKILNNAIVESNSNTNIIVSRGGRIINV